MKSIEIGFPTADERMELLSGDNLKSFFTSEIYNEDIKLYTDNSKDLKHLMEKFVARTEGFSFFELTNLRNLCRNAQIHIQNICSAIDLYTYGIKDNPWENKELKEKLRNAEDYFGHIKGQKEAIIKTLDVAKRAISGMSGLQHSSDTKPKGVLFFAGPTGTG